LSVHSTSFFLVFFLASFERRGEEKRGLKIIDGCYCIEGRRFSGFGGGFVFYLSVSSGISFDETMGEKCMM